MAATVEVPKVPRLSVPKQQYRGLPRMPSVRGALAQQPPRTLLNVTRPTTGALPTLARSMVLPLSVPSDEDAEFAPVDDSQPVPGSDPIPLPATQPELSASLLDKPLLEAAASGLRSLRKALKRAGVGAWPKKAAAAASGAAARFKAPRARLTVALVAVAALLAVVVAVSRLVSTMLSVAAVAAVAVLLAGRL